MRISVNVSPAEVTLIDPNVFNSFDVVAQPPDASEAEVAAALGAGGAAAGDDHVWITVDEIERLAGSAVTTEWQSNFELMLAFAASKGWTDDDQRMIKGHIVRP